MSNGLCTHRWHKRIAVPILQRIHFGAAFSGGMIPEEYR
jgi:hypothetical protein